MSARFVKSALLSQPFGSLRGRSGVIGLQCFSPIQCTIGLQRTPQVFQDPAVDQPSEGLVIIKRKCPLERGGGFVFLVEAVLSKPQVGECISCRWFGALPVLCQCFQASPIGTVLQSRGVLFPLPFGLGLLRLRPRFVTFGGDSIEPI
ncbi:hypothetical protein D9M69_509290 [compost metagenome]